MGKNSPSFVLKAVFKDISNIENVIKDSKVVEQSCEQINFDDDKEVKKIIEDTKHIVTSLKDKATKIDHYFKENYKNWKKELKKVSVNENGLSSSINESLDVSELNLQQTIAQDTSSEQGEKEKEAENNGAEHVLNDNKNRGSSDESSVTERDKQASEQGENEETLESCSVIEKQDKQDLENENNSSTNQNVESKDKTEKAHTPKVFLKCVDFSKLVKPEILPALKSPSSDKKKKRVSISDTVLIISDSDTEGTVKPVKKTVKRVSFADDCKKSDDETPTKSKFQNGNKESPFKLCFNKKTAAKGKQAKKNLLKDKQLSDSSSNSDADVSGQKVKKSISKNSKPKSKSAKNQKIEALIISAQTDKKFSYKSYVPLPRIPCEKLIDIYKNNKEISEIKRLTDLNSLEKTSKNKKKKMRDSSSSDSENVKPKAKKAKVSSKKDHSSDEGSHSDTTDVMDTTEPIPSIPDEPVPNNELANDAVKMLLDNINSGSDKSTNESDADDEDEDAENKKKSKKHITDKKSKKSSKENNKQESSDGSSDSEDEKKEKPKKKKKESNKSKSSDSSDSEDGKREQAEEKKKENKESGDSDLGDGKKDKSKKKMKESKKSESSDSDNEKKKNDEKSDNTSEDSDDKKKKEKKKWRKDKLLTVNISSNSESEDELVKFKRRAKTAKEDVKARISKKKSKIVIESDSGSDNGNKKKVKDNNFKPTSSSSSSSSSSSESHHSEPEVEEKSKKKSRIKRVKDSSSDEDKSTRKSIRKVIAHESLAETTKQAEKEERERKARIAERQKKYNQIFETDKPKDTAIDKVVLDFNEETKEEIIAVDKDLVKKLKPHQAKGVQFMWDACYETVERIKNTEGSGCILAHCMGLGKTLQVITLVHTLMANDELTKVQKVLIVCPVNTVLNWVSEFDKWLSDIEGPSIEVYDLVSAKQNNERKYQIEQWSKNGGVLVIGYDMFRNLTNPSNKRLKKSQREIFQKALVNPGADLVICDEGHLLKNEKSNLSIAMNRLHTLRRIVLTGTPMQNNMKEYYCMVQFVKPNLLGTYKEYINRFVNPITNGQYTDSTPHDINIMRKRSHVLHKMLDGVVQRKDYSVLTPYLPPKYEYVLFITLTETQIKLYQYYLTELSRKPVDTKMRTSFLFVDFQELQRICTHPRVLLLKSEEDQRKKLYIDDEDSEGSLKDFIDDGSGSSTKSSSSSSSSNSDSEGSGSDSKQKKSKSGGPRLTRNSAAAQGIDVDKELEIMEADRIQDEWWGQFCSSEELDNIALSSKLYLLFEILQECELIGDKLLVFSQSLYSLNIIEYFLAKIDEATQNGENEKVCGFSGSWALGLDYFRLDGSSSCDNRSAWCRSFNSPENTRARLFLISTRAGGLGINLVGANRVIIFDVSWNPSHDIQSIYRVYRFGQTKPCYIYRFVTNGTMEMKIYERQVTKQAISKRVIDEQQIDRHYNQNDLAELYNFEPKPADQPTPLIPKDVLLAEMLQKERDRIFKYHEHQSLLENKEDEELDEAERKAAWEEYENEKTARAVPANNMGGWIKNLPLTSITAALNSIVKKDNPSWSAHQVQSVIPLVVQQLREQVERGDAVV